MSQPVVHCVLGMHRSGTSLLTRCLAFIGVELGPDGHLLAATEFNPTGFWEHEGIQKLNDEILAAFGGSWRDVPALAPGWERDARLESLRARAAEVIAADFADSAAWGFKDPRTCLTLPFWKPLLPGLRFVLCLRNPSDVARSLEHTMPFGEGVALWLRYVEASLRHTAGEPRAVVFYEDLLAETAGELRRLASSLGIADGPALEAALVEAAKFARADMRHHRTDIAELMADDRVPFAAKSLFAALLAHSPARPENFLEALAAAAMQTSPPAGRDEWAGSVERAVFANDPLHRADPGRYFDWGRTALQVVRAASVAAARSGFSRILDADGGFGRVTRWLRAAFPNSTLSLRNQNAEAVAFCAGHFRTRAATPGERFDLIWAGTILMQRNSAEWRGMIAGLRDELAPGGVLILATNGCWAAQRRGVALDSVAVFVEGASFAPLPWALENLPPGLRVIHAAERGWFHYHDTIACLRTEEEG